MEWHWGITKHRTDCNGTEYTRINWNMPEQGGMTGIKLNDTEIRLNEQEWYQNIPERAGMTPKSTGI